MPGHALPGRLCAPASGCCSAQSSTVSVAGEVKPGGLQCTSAQRSHAIQPVGTGCSTVVTSHARSWRSDAEIACHCRAGRENRVRVAGSAGPGATQHVSLPVGMILFRVGDCPASPLW